MKLNTIPLLDNFETTLAQTWDGQIGGIKVDDLPDLEVDENNKFFNGLTTYVVVNPGKNNMQIAEIDGFNKETNTFNVININLKRGNEKDYKTSYHNQKSVVRISNNFAFWQKLKEVINSKWDYADGNIDIDKDFILNILKNNFKINVKVGNANFEIENGILTFKDKERGPVTLKQLGDMHKEVYDSDNTGKVDISENTEKFKNKEIGDFVLKDEVINNLNSSETNKPLSANKGKEIKTLINNLIKSQNYPTAGFRNISNCVYTKGELTSFKGDGVNYTLTYTKGLLTKVNNSVVDFNINYDSSGNFIGIN